VEEYAVDRDHSRLIIILLSVIAAVLLFGREATFGSMQTIFWVALALGIVALIVWAIVSSTRYMGREARAYRDEVRRDREEGRPWLHTYIAWPGIIGNLLVFVVAAYWRFIDDSCRALMGDCLQQIPYWWAPVCLLLASIPIAGLERMIAHFRKPRAID
jgi:amino acid permease